MKFTPEMELSLVDLCEKYFDDLHPNSRAKNYSETRNSAWKSVCDELNANFPLAKIDLSQLQAKWKKLKQSACAEFKAHKRFVLVSIST